MSSREGKVVLVTSGSSGIGLATAQEFHEHGANVVITGRNQERLEAVAQQLGDNVLALEYHGNRDFSDYAKLFS